LLQSFRSSNDGVHKLAPSSQLYSCSNASNNGVDAKAGEVDGRGEERGGGGRKVPVGERREGGGSW